MSHHRLKSKSRHTRRVDFATEWIIINKQDQELWTLGRHGSRDRLLWFPGFLPQTPCRQGSFQIQVGFFNRWLCKEYSRCLRVEMRQVEGMMYGFYEPFHMIQMVWTYALAMSDEILSEVKSGPCWSRRYVRKKETISSLLAMPQKCPERG
jgi:hypothetical protein